MEDNAGAKEVSPELLAVLACPLDHGKLTFNSSANTLACQKCGHEYKIENGVPNMLVSK